MTTLSRLLTVIVVLASAASAKEPFRGESGLPFVSQIRAVEAKTVSMYEGTIDLATDHVPVCLEVSSRLVDGSDGDGRSVHQDVSLWEITPLGYNSCDTTLQHNGGTLKTCEGFYLTGALTLSSGAVARTPKNGAPIGTWQLRRVERCSF